jgi:uncharacterized protein with HEPN domain
MNNKEKIWFEHILFSAEKAISFADGRSKDELHTNDMLYFAILKAVEIIGEAASRISQETMNEYPDIPWRNIVAMRNRLVHGYFDVDYDILWAVVKERLPELVEEIKRILS